MTAAIQIVTECYNELASPQRTARRQNNPAPTLDQIRAALERFEQPAELANTATESYLINMGLIERHITAAQLVARKRRKHGQYAKKLYKLTYRGYFFLRDLRARSKALVVVNECRALVPYNASPSQFARQFMLDIWWSYYRDPELEALIEEMSLKKVQECPF